MIEVKLISQSTADPLCLAEKAAKTCYQPEAPILKETANQEVRDFIMNNIFRTGHHTVLEHQFFTFEIEGVAVSDVSFGLHLANPFYNSDQRSGRFCAKMFDNPNTDWLDKYISYYWPKTQGCVKRQIIDYFLDGIKTYRELLPKATEVALEQIKIERPKLSQEKMETLAPKIAQEQLRVFIPAMIPTGLVISLDLTSILSLYKSAWTPVLKDITEKMRQEITLNNPELDIFFEETGRLDKEWFPKIDSFFESFSRHPKISLKGVSLKNLKAPKKLDLHPLDILQFSPEFMENNCSFIKTRVAVSLMTFGQDQRHRTIKRDRPSFTGSFYLPPLVSKLIKGKHKRLFVNWLDHLRLIMPPTLHTAIAPFGAMVSYEKAGNINALIHEQGKRLCFNAQEEIYNLSVKLRRLLEKRLGSNHELLSFLSPPCMIDGKCGEGKRFCGRFIKDFPKRIV